MNQDFDIKEFVDDLFGGREMRLEKTLTDAINESFAYYQFRQLFKDEEL